MTTDNQESAGTDKGQRFLLSTDEFAKLNQVKSQSIRARVCRTGAYFGVRPVTLANGRLAWPDVQVLADGTNA